MNTNTSSNTNNLLDAKRTVKIRRPEATELSTNSQGADKSKSTVKIRGTETLAQTKTVGVDDQKTTVKIRRPENLTNLTFPSQRVVSSSSASDINIGKDATGTSIKPERP